jgi:uncharacterized membrane protein YqaE (UPF0057 family)
MLNKMKEKILELQGHNILINGRIYNLENLNINNEYAIITFDNLVQYFKNINSNFSISDDDFILFNGKIISKDFKFKYNYKNENVINENVINENVINENVINQNTRNNQNFQIIDIIKKQKGGSIIDAFMSIIKLGEFFLTLGDVFTWLLKFILWIIDFVTWLLFDLLNPKTIFNEFFKTLVMIVTSLANLVFNIVLTCFKLTVNTIAGWTQGFWGWDMSSLTKNDKNSPYFKSFDKNKGQKVYYTNSNTVPFSIILGTILCPPMGVFMDLGITGWINIIVCALLTLMFYLPGLTYALLIIYS